MSKRRKSRQPRVTAYRRLRVERLESRDLLSMGGLTSSQLDTAATTLDQLREIAKNWNPGVDPYFQADRGVVDAGLDLMEKAGIDTNLTSLYTFLYGIRSQQKYARF